MRLLKRVGGLPGETIELGESRLRVGDRTLLFAPSVERGPQPPAVPPGAFFLVGDTVRSFDIRYFGPVPRNACVHLLRIF